MDKKNIQQRIVDVLGDVPVRFEVEDKEYCIYPPTLGRELILEGLRKKLGIDPGHAKESPLEEVLRVCADNKDIVLRILALCTLQGKEALFNEDMINDRITAFGDIPPEDLATLLLTASSNVDIQDFVKYFGIDRDNDNRREIARLRESDSYTVTFGGHSIFGGLIDFACARYGWKPNYVVWGVSLTTLQMLYYDRMETVLLSKEEFKKARLKQGGSVINADDPANMAKIKAMKWD